MQFWKLGAFVSPFSPTIGTVRFTSDVSGTVSGWRDGTRAAGVKGISSKCSPPSGKSGVNKPLQRHGPVNQNGCVAQKPVRCLVCLCGRSWGCGSGRAVSFDKCFAMQALLALPGQCSSHWKTSHLGRAGICWQLGPVQDVCFRVGHCGRKPCLLSTGHKSEMRTCAQGL